MLHKKRARVNALQRALGGYNSELLNNTSVNTMPD